MVNLCKPLTQSRCSEYWYLGVFACLLLLFKLTDVVNSCLFRNKVKFLCVHFGFFASKLNYLDEPPLTPTVRLRDRRYQSTTKCTTLMACQLRMRQDVCVDQIDYFYEQTHSQRFPSRYSTLSYTKISKQSQIPETQPCNLQEKKLLYSLTSRNLSFPQNIHVKMFFFNQVATEN